jgi:CDP-diacylglycerol--serine O-phosphatidyltransferase
MQFKKHIPNAITCGNLLSGCVGIVYAFNGDLKTVAFFVLLSGILDFFDGFAARLLNVKSDIGKELDSLADVVSFGFLPGVIMFQMLQNLQMGTWAYLGFSITIFSALRLAKFNIDNRQTEDFIGLNTPTNTFFIISLPWLIVDFPSINNSYLLIAFILITSYLLVSELYLFSLKFTGLAWEPNKYKFILIIISIVLLAFIKFAAIPVILVLYILFSQLHFKYTK